MWIKLIGFSNRFYHAGDVEVREYYFFDGQKLVLYDYWLYKQKHNIGYRQIDRVERYVRPFDKIFKNTDILYDLWPLIDHNRQSLAALRKKIGK